MDAAIRRAAYHWHLLGLSLGDFDEDGIPDLSAGHNAGVRAWVDDGVPETLGSCLQIASPATTGLHLAVDAGDWNHDGKLDLLAAAEGGGIQLWTGDGGYTWAEIAGTTAPGLPATGTYQGRHDDPRQAGAGSAPLDLILSHFLAHVRYSQRANAWLPDGAGALL